MIDWRRRWLMVFGGGLVSATVGAVDTVRIATEAWPDFVNADGTGLYLELSKQVFEPAGYAISVRIVPFKRALFHLENHLDDAMFGTYAAPTDAVPYLFTPQHPILDERAVAVFLTQSGRSWNGSTSLTGQRVAIVRGYNYDAFLGVAFDLIETSSLEQSWTMLDRHRVTFLVDVSVDVKRHLQRNQLDASGYRIETVLSNPIYMAFANTARGKQLAAVFDQRMATLIASGEAQALYQKWDVDFPLLPGAH